MRQSVLEVRFGQLAWDRRVDEVRVVYARFGWEHPMDGDYMSARGSTRPPAA